MYGIDTMMMTAGLWTPTLPLAAEGWVALLAAGGVVSAIGILWSGRGHILESLRRKTPLRGAVAALEVSRLHG